MPGHHEVRVAGDEHESLGRVPARLELVELEMRTPGSTTQPAPIAQHPAITPVGICRILYVVTDDDGVAGVRAALVAADEIGVLRKQVDDLSLALVAPLRADDDGRGHVSQSCS